MTDLGFSGDDGYEPDISRRLRRTKKVVVALAGLAALTAGGVVLVTEVMPAEVRLVPELAAPAPRLPIPMRAPKADSPYLAPARTSSHRSKRKHSELGPIKSAAAPRRSPVPFMSPPMSLAQRVAIVRAADSDGVLPAPKPRPFAAVAATAPEITVTWSTRWDELSFRWRPSSTPNCCSWAGR